LSASRPVRFGVPQGSVQGPLLFIIYTAELNHVVASHHLNLHQYADDCQIYSATPPSQFNRRSQQTCMLAVLPTFTCGWASVNCASTRQRPRSCGSGPNSRWKSRKQGYGCFVDISACSGLDTIWASFWTASSSCQHTAHISVLCQTGFYINSGSSDTLFVRHRLMSLEPSSKLSFHSRLDYCNALLNGFTDAMFKRLQSVQNAAARLGGTRRGEMPNTMPVLNRLHWLPVRQGVTYKWYAVHSAVHFRHTSPMTAASSLIQAAAPSGRLILDR
jgi:hypothetical protein